MAKKNRTEYLSKMRVSTSLKKGLVKMAESESRSINNMVEVILQKAVNEYQDKK